MESPTPPETSCSPSTALLGRTRRYTNGREYAADDSVVASTLSEPTNGREYAADDSVVGSTLSDKQRTITLVLLAFSNFCYGVSNSLYGPFFPMQAEDKGLLPRYYGFIIGSHHLTALLFTPIIGMWVQAVATKFMLFTGLFTVGGCAILFGTLERCPNGTPFAALGFAIRILDGFGAASIQASVFAIAASQFTSERWTTFIKLQIAFGCGMVVGPIAGGALYDFGGFCLPFYCSGVLTLLDAVLVMSIIPKPSEIIVKVTKEFWFTFTLTGNFLYFFGIFSAAYYSGYLEAALFLHMKQFHFKSLYVGLIFQVPDAVYTLLVYGWKTALRKGINSVMLIFIAGLLLITSIIFLSPAEFTHLEKSIVYIVPALALKGIGQSSRNICSFYGAYSDSVCQGLPNDVSTHSLIFEMYIFGSLAGNFIGSFFAGYIYERIGFNIGILIPLGMEVILAPFVLSYAFRRYYRTPVLHRAEESHPVMSENEYRDQRS